MYPLVEQEHRGPESLHSSAEVVYVCIRETGQIVTIAEARNRYRNKRWSFPVRRPTDPIQFLG